MENFKPNPYYLEAIEAYLSAQTSRLQTLIESEKLNRIEKELIQTRILIRDKNWRSAEDRISKISTANDFYLGEIHFLMGNIQGFNANWEKAILENTQAYQRYEACQDQRGLFLASYNLSVDYSSLGLYQISSKYLLQAQENVQSDRHQSQILRGLAWNNLNSGQVQAALESIEKGLHLNTDAYPSERNMFLAVAADIYFRLGKYDEAYDLMKTLKYSKSLRDKSRINFEFKLLEKMRTESLPYRGLDFPSEELSLSGEYRLKWNIVRSLLNGERKMADTYWSQLCFLFPMYYAPNYVCVNAIESKSIFMCFLSKVLNFKHALEESPIKAISSTSMTKLQQLVQLLLNSSLGLRKEDLIEKIWNEKYEPSMDAKLYKLIQRLRDQSEFEIFTQNQCYHLKKLGS